MSIPIFQLPKDALMNILKNMDELSLLFISLNSKFSKSLIKSLNLKACVVDFFFDVSFTIGIMFRNRPGFQFCFSEFSDDSCELKPITVKYDMQDFFPFKQIAFKYPKIGFVKMFNHIIDVVNCKTVDCYMNRPIKQIDIKSFKEALEHVDIKKVGDIHDDYFYDLMKMFPNTKELQLDPMQTIDSNCPSYRKLLIQNFDFSYLGLSIPVDLNTLLSMNCSTIELDGLILTDKDINVFIKCWMKGSNPRLEYLYMGCKRLDDMGVKYCKEEIIMKNISHRKAPTDQKRTFKLSNDSLIQDDRSVKIDGGNDILRKDGTKATISIDSDEERFQLIVWNLIE